MRGRPRPHVDAWIVGVLTLIALALRWACVHQSLFGDELFLYSDVHGHSLGEVFSAVHDTEKTPPLYFILGWIFARGSDPTVLVRVPSLVAGAATVPLVFLLGRRTVGRAAGLVAAAWFALSPFQIFYGTEARGYALVTALVVLSTLALLAALDGRGVAAWALYALAAAAAIYTHYIAALVLIPQAAWALWTHRESIRGQLIANGIVVLVWLPWLPSFVVQARHSGDEARRLSALVPLTVSNAVKAEGQSLVGHPYVNLAKLPGTVPMVVLGVVLAAALALGLALPARRWPAIRDGRLLALLALVAPLAIIIYSARPHRSFLLPRNASVAVPYALLLIGWLLTVPRRRIAAAALSAAALACVAVGSVKMLERGYQRPDGRDIARFIDAHAPPRAPVLDVPGPQGTQFYFKRVHPLPGLARFGPAQWSEAARTRTPVFLTFLRTPFLEKLGPPPQVAARFRLAAEHTSPSIPAPLTVREYVAR